MQPTTGTLVVVASGRSATSIPATSLSLQRIDGTWVAVGNVSGAVPAAPSQSELLVLAFPVGRYEHIRFRGDVERVSITVTAGQVEPLLLGIHSGNLIPGAVYAGNDEVNLGLGELAGRFVPMPQFALVDQNLRDFNSFSTAGKDVVIGAFHTTCHETCPLYTALFFQLAKRVSANVTLAEVTTDPDVDTPAALLDYRTRIGATWEFATGSRDQVASFWKPFGVDLAT
ncbi:MAG TPA: SCO family protein, partial [Candidatus Dormibacteraeota bacterium]|nr:SCO family protein [Candidatus Dormibacteraeota bacterium]